MKEVSKNKHVYLRILRRRVWEEPIIPWKDWSYVEGVDLLLYQSGVKGMGVG